MTPDEDCLNPLRLTPEQKYEVLERVDSTTFTFKGVMKSAEDFSKMMHLLFNIKSPGEMAIHQGMALFYTDDNPYFKETSNG